MNNLVFLPVLLPLLTGIILIFFSKSIRIQRTLSVISFVIGVLLSTYLVSQVYTNGILTLDVSNWKAPFGITLVADMLAALLVLTTNIIALCVLLYSFTSIGIEREKFYYYSFFNFLIVGVNGAFLTGDVFNLFVFFEVMLMSSYVLLVLGGTKIQLRESLKYILVNVISSALFVIAVAMLYSIVGTLNMADISKRVAEVGQPGQLTVIAILFLIVFGLKGAIFPLFYWLPGSYAAAPTPVLALFGALLTKVGIYSIFRTYTLIFYHDSGFTHQFLGVLSLVTIIIGVIGAVAYWDLKKIVIYNIVIAVGVIAYGISLLNEAAVMGSVFYLLHDMIIKAALFLLIGIMAKIAGTYNLREFSGLIHKYPYVGWAFFIAALSLGGIPPLSGFIGKLLIVQGAFQAKDYWGAGIVLMSSLLVLYSIMKIFIHGVWGKPQEYKGSPIGIKSMLIPSAILVAISALFGLGIEFLYPYISTATDTLMDPTIYIEAVLKE
ncbi:Na+/H+ antiporter subunit D [Peribacillus acanthi]|uniref:Na+/H+ antiporter subunit D n=1 Tax=Peribacillus acanthi TaxID=2171554 RepID=UPI000D3E634A|nr:Na+/H+ antiporter subunit D [Peribacillus acanthi]